MTTESLVDGAAEEEAENKGTALPYIENRVCRETDHESDEAPSGVESMV